MRGYFGIGVERLSKPHNAGALFRSAHAFGASFVFTIGAEYRRGKVHSDTSDAAGQVPLHQFAGIADLALPEGCALIGIEFLEDAVDLPSFRHPSRAAYVLGSERFTLSPELQARCAHIVRIPTRFCINLSVAGALVMYDRLLAMGRYAERAVGSLAQPVLPAPHVRGGVKIRSRA
ncbi:MAG: RNA methyltransferase [Alphaproteobacteria bacterium]|nr:RNA methyltransferase [Alphaproteobacteria bacterium]